MAEAKCKVCGVNSVSGGTDVCDPCGEDIIKKAAASPKKVAAAKKLIARQQQKKNAGNN